MRNAILTAFIKFPPAMWHGLVAVGILLIVLAI